MRLVEVTEEYLSTRLLYYFWLPSGKDEFGFDDRGSEAPLAKTAEYRRANPHEETIARRVKNQMQALQGNHPDLAGLTWTGRLTPKDGDLGLRKLEYAFEYQHSGTTLTGIIPDAPISGDALMLSNGLYLWRFDLEYRRDTTEETLHAAAADFLRDDFIQKYIRKVLGLGWPSPEADRLGHYTGILTYYQLDLLLNGLFDGTAHPHAFLSSPEKPQNKYLYSLDGIIKSGSLYALNDRHEPLYDVRKKYTLRGYEAEYRIKTSADVFDVDTGRTTKQAREMLLSRLSYAAMEQFLRVSISFGVIYYKAGLAHCRTELVDRGLLARINRRSGEIQRPSLPYSDLTLADLEAYYTVIAGKLPALELVRHMIQDLAEASRPFGVDENSDVSTGLLDWRFSQGTLDEALSQLNRQLIAIYADIATIERSLTAARMDQVLSELTEARKLAEIDAESPRQIVVRRSGEDNAELTLQLTYFALLLGALEVISNGGTWLSEQFQQGRFYAEGISAAYKYATWAPPAVLIAVTILFVWWLRRRARAQQRQLESSSGGRDTRTMVLDYSFLNRTVDAPNGSQYAVNEISSNLRDLQSSERIPSRGLSIFRETPASGVERIKYSIESAVVEDITYILHIEVDQRWESGEEQLRDVRLVVRLPRDSVTDVTHGAYRVIAACVRELVLARADDATKNQYFRNHFGWTDSTLWSAHQR
jgi:hypothetical protein